MMLLMMLEVLVPGFLIFFVIVYLYDKLISKPYKSHDARYFARERTIASILFILAICFVTWFAMVMVVTTFFTQAFPAVNGIPSGFYISLVYTSPSWVAICWQYPSFYRMVRRWIHSGDTMRDWRVAAFPLAKRRCFVCGEKVKERNFVTWWWTKDRIVHQWNDEKSMIACKECYMTLFSANLPSRETRECSACGKEMDVESCIVSNLLVDWRVLFKVLRLWDDDHVDFFCCDCYRELLA
jgi:uncharacterized paraquat-inducible protein A